MLDETSSEQTQAGLAEVLGHLKASGYRFVTPTPETHGRVLQRGQREAKDLRDVFGWNLSFADGVLPDGLVATLGDAGLLDQTPAGRRSRIRVASVGTDLFVHSAYPAGGDAVFFGPDSYRFARLIRQRLARRRIGAAIDLGAGAGVGAVTLARCAEVASLHMTDVNRLALSYARVAADHAGVRSDFHLGELDAVQGPIDLVIANPPFIADSGQTYSDGGEGLGVGVALDWTKAALARLNKDGQILLYTGSPVVGGTLLLEAKLRALTAQGGCAVELEEIDPDIFSEELVKPAYRSAERIAAVGALITKA